MKIAILKDKEQANRHSDLEVKLIDEISTLPIGFYTEIVLDKTLDLLPSSEREGILSSLLTKLRYNGLITIIGTDYYELCRQVVLQNLADPKEISSLFENLKSISSIFVLENDLTSKGLVINTKGLEGLEYIISGKKVLKK